MKSHYSLWNIFTAKLFQHYRIVHRKNPSSSLMLNNKNNNIKLSIYDDYPNNIQAKKPLPWEEIQGRGNTGVKDIFIVLMITKELLAGLSIHTSWR